MGSWLFAAFIFSSAIVTIASKLQEEHKMKESITSTAILSSIYLILFAAMVVATAMISASEPTDPSVQLERTLYLSK